MTEDIFWIISNYNQNPKEVIDSLNGPFIICNQGNKGCIPEEYYNKNLVKDVKHTGHNISDYLNFIIENYDNLPERLGMIKGNIFPRHIEKEKFIKRIMEKDFVPLYSDENTYSPTYHRIYKWKLVSQQISPGIYLEIANNWYCKTRKVGKKSQKLEDFILHFFGKQKPEYINFVPGACMIVPRHKINRWPLEMYKEMYEFVTYDFFPVEAFHAERCMLYLFSYSSE